MDFGIKKEDYKRNPRIKKDRTYISIRGESKE